MLFVFEGWDELPPKFRDISSFFMKIIAGFKLVNASVMVTSRPSVSGELQDYMERHIEVLGFNSGNIREYINQNISDEDKAKELSIHLGNFPNLQALAHIPLTLSIMCSVIKKNGSLPHTLTALYEKYILEVLLGAMKKKCSTSHTGFTRLHEIEDSYIREVISRLSKVAFENFKKKRFTFTKSDLGREACMQDDTSHYLGLMNSFDTHSSAGYVKVYQFIHLSVQEFLAAYHMQGLPHAEQITLLNEYRSDKQFLNIWRFLSGITGLKNVHVRDKILSDTRQTNESQLFLIHCLYEASDSVACSVAAEKLKSVLNLNNQLLNPADCLCAAYVVSKGGNWTLDLRGCYIGDEGLRVMKDFLLSQTHKDTFGIELLE